MQKNDPSRMTRSVRVGSVGSSVDGTVCSASDSLSKHLVVLMHAEDYALVL